MLEKILKVATCFDWLSPTAAVVQDLANGPSHTFMIPEDCGWTGYEIISLLRSYGIKTWGHMAINGQFTISVRQAQADFARYILERAGLLVGAGPASSSSRRRKGSEGARDVLSEIGDMRLF